MKGQPDCETVVNALRDKIKAQCPRGKESLLASPSPEDIEKLVCKLASSELVERRPPRRFANSSRSMFQWGDAARVDNGECSVG